MVRSVCADAWDGHHRPDPGRDVRHYVHRDGRTTDGSADPTWWLGAAPTAPADTRLADARRH
ncbi:hypothetical protein [Kitasatospora sp. NPDC093102]|uniref:hypothetical protein n=1 Tax=Kitasatospora sp. NPDC093102 TaxID=3155069 RepID=UPI003431C02C